MLQFMLGKLQDLMQVARDVYGVNPVIFLIIYLGCTPFWYYSIFRTARAAAARRANQLMLWSAVFLATTAAPFVYVMLFGHNLPWWVYMVLVLLIGQGAFSLVRVLRRGPVARSP
jgi:hypothetical protein